jgi:hypothetical protein
MSTRLRNRDRLAAAAQPALVLLALVGLGLTMPRPAPAPKPRPVAAPPRPAPPPVVAVVSPEPEPEPEPAPPPPPPQPDRAAIARAEAARDAAATARREAEARIAAEEAALADARRAAEAIGAELKALASQVRTPGARIEAARAKGAVLKSEADKIRAELISLADAPRPRRKSLVDKTPLARPAEGPEFHFEVRGDRVAFVDVDRLVDRVKADAQLQLRIVAGGNPGRALRPIRSSVGPVGDFAMKYELGADLGTSLGDLVQPGRVSFTLTGWEIVPVRERRGEPLGMLGQPGSDLARVLGAVNPQLATITLWVYPDGFATYRALREYLHQRGFLVAARPLPSGMAIRGSPNGSLSAGH